MALGLALVGLAIWRVSRDPQSWHRLGEATKQPWHLAALGACVLANIALAGWLFQRLYRPVVRIGLGEMEVLVASSSLLNYLPAKAGLAGRALYHKVVHGVPLSVSVRLIVLSAVGTLLTSGLLVSFVLVLGAHAGNEAVAGWIAGGALALWVAPRMVDCGPVTRAFLESIAIRQLDLGVWCLRYVVAFSAIGIDIDLRAAALAAASAMLIGLLPFLANGMGLREWAVAFLGGIAAGGWTEDAGLSADLLNRAVDLAVVVPMGALATWFALRWMQGRAASRRPSPQPLG